MNNDLDQIKNSYLRGRLNPHNDSNIRWKVLLLDNEKNLISQFAKVKWEVGVPQIAKIVQSPELGAKNILEIGISIFVLEEEARDYTKLLEEYWSARGENRKYVICKVKVEGFKCTQHYKDKYKCEIWGRATIL